MRRVSLASGSWRSSADKRGEEALVKHLTEKDRQVTFLRQTLIDELGMNFRELSRAPENSEQFVWLNRRYGETGTQLGRWAITPSIRADSSQDEVI